MVYIDDEEYEGYAAYPIDECYVSYDNENGYSSYQFECIDENTISVSNYSGTECGGDAIYIHL